MIIVTVIINLPPHFPFEHLLISGAPIGRKQFSLDKAHWL